MLKKLFCLLPFGKDRAKADRESVEALRNLFQTRYHHFKLLLTANNQALERMTDIEEKLRWDKPFSMQYVRSQCTKVGASVFSVVKNLSQLAPGKYDALFPRFKDIQLAVNVHLSSSYAAEEPDAPLVVHFADLDMRLASQTGTKMASLAEAAGRLGLATPGGFVLTAACYRNFMRETGLWEEVSRLIQTLPTDDMEALFKLSQSIQQAVVRADVPGPVREALATAYAALESEAGQGVKVAMRSSALGEDAHGASFAGQYKSQLNVGPDSLVEVYKEIVAGKYSVQAMSYRLRRGLRDEDTAMCVGVLPMIAAKSGGVAYSVDPMLGPDDPADAVIVNAVFGLPKPVVDGAEAVDVFRVDRNPPHGLLAQSIAVKERRFDCDPIEGVCRFNLTAAEAAKPALSPAEAAQVAALAMRLEAWYKAPQDVEWAFDAAGRLVLLQCRPLTRASGEASTAAGRVEAPAGATVLLEGGEPAASGAGDGAVFIVRKDMDALAFPDGGVLVAAQALPRLAALLSRASAVLTEQGSIAGHLANVAREFGAPALFGVPGLLKTLENGREVTVDADARRVYDGLVPEICRKPEKSQNPMIGSPVYQSLEKAAGHIIPLNLLDPDAYEFKPESCRTFHDLTRFCHEKAVHEMFAFGSENAFPERAARQLYVEVPMQFWVIDLDDGLVPEPKYEKFVYLNEIVSTPFHAVWRGMTAIPWDGPPPVDAKGFMSIMLEAQTNPSLVPGMPSAYSAKNYFMLSKHFLSLQSRFGFHFLTVESLVGERTAENYASFQFKGGAADMSRRMHRATMVGELLEEQGFRTEVREDCVLARIEGFERDYMESRLEVIGYLLIHTRQLDMVMKDRSRALVHKEKMRKDMEALAEKTA